MFEYSSIENVDLPDSVKNIGSAFGDSRIRSVVVPDGTTEIVDYAFLNCRNLSTVVIPDSVTSIGDSAFAKCSITEIKLDNIKSIRSGAFSECRALKSAVLSPDLQYLGYGVFEYCSALEYVNIPDTLKEIPNSTFKGCSSLKTIVLPYSVERIGVSAFCETSLEYIDIPRSVKTIDHLAFYDSKLTALVIPDSVESMGIMIFSKSVKYVYFGCSDVPIDFLATALLFMDSTQRTFYLPACTDPEKSSYSILSGYTFYDSDKTTKISGTFGALGGYTWSTVGMPQNCAYKVADTQPETLTYTWVNYDGTVLQKASGISPGESPFYTGEIPENKFGLTFCGWSVVDDGFGNVTLVATFQDGELIGLGGDVPGEDGGIQDYFESLSKNAESLFVVRLIKTFFNFWFR